MTRSRMLSACSATGRALMLLGMLAPLAGAIAADAIGPSTGSISASAIGAGNGADVGSENTGAGAAPVERTATALQPDQGRAGAVITRTRLELSPAYNPNGPMRGRIGVLDAATGVERFGVLGPRVDDLFGYAGIGVGDVDGDGVEDIAVSAPNSFDASVGGVAHESTAPRYEIVAVQDGGSGVREPQVLKSIEPIPVHLRFVTDVPQYSGALAWDPEAKSFYAVTSASLGTTLALQVYEIPVGMSEDGIRLQTSTDRPKLVRSMSLTKDLFKRLDAAPLLRKATIEDGQLSIELLPKTPNKAAPCVELDLNSGEWNAEPAE